MATAFIAIGANLGDPMAQAQGALADIAALPATRLIATSPWYRSQSLSPGQPDYLNGAICIETAMKPIELLDALQQIELAHGRQRLQHWGPRTLDLDLLLYDDLTLQSERLILPHPQLINRNFVVVPLLDIAPQLALPDGSKIAALAAALGRDGLAHWQ